MATSGTGISLTQSERAQRIADERIKMLADRLSVLLVICNARDEDDWNPWALDRSYDDENSMGDHIRRMSDYKTAKTIVRRWVEKTDERTRDSLQQ